MCFSQAKEDTAPLKKVPIDGILVRAKVIDGDTVPYVTLSEIKVFGERTFKDPVLAEKYRRLKRDVKKVYPYAVLAGIKLKEYDAVLAKMPLEAERKIYMKKVEKELKKQFEGDVRNMTMTQGRILIKLIDRETGNTSYDLVKELRGSFSAFMWQSVARLFGSSLKSEYDPQGDDKMIEQIIQLIQSGQI